MKSAAVKSASSAGALRSRRSRQRRRQGVASYRVDVPIDRFLDALVASQRLTERQVQELRRVEGELEAVIGDFINRWK
jgi:hypothetical protein